MLRSFYSGLVNFILPNTCISCSSIIGAEEKYLCEKCYALLETYQDTHPWQEEFISAGTIDYSLSAFWFREGTPVQTLFHALKYGHMKNAGLMLGEAVAKKIIKTKAEPFDLIVPVPLHKAKFRERTYNQSMYIAKGISDIMKIPVFNDAVIRTRFTGTQTKLTKPERKENVKGAFAVNPKQAGNIAGRNIILVDDVITTGATILECASALKASGCGRLWACSAAYAELKLNVV